MPEATSSARRESSGGESRGGGGQAGTTAVLTRGRLDFAVESTLAALVETKLALEAEARVMQMEALPRNATGKILKTKLREIAAEKYAR